MNHEPRRFRYGMRPTPKNKHGKRAIYIGVRFGYFPCIRAPFIQFDIVFWRWCFWYGDPSYK